MHRRNGFWNTTGGYQYNLVLSVVAAGLAFTGPGQRSIDHPFGLSFASDWWGLAALAAGLIVGTATLAKRDTDPTHRRRGAEVEAT